MDNNGLFRDGMPLTLLEATPLFAQDHLAAMREIRDGHPPYVSRQRILHVLDLTQRIAAGQTGDVPPHSE